MCRESPTDAPPAARTSNSPHEESPISDFVISGSDIVRASHESQSPDSRATSPNGPRWIKKTLGVVVCRVEPDLRVSIGCPSCRCQRACAPLVAAPKEDGLVAAGGGGGGGRR